jgi:CPA1 family monovalent cation:H+ antiporter
MLEAERSKVLELRRGGRYAHEVLSEVLERLDIEESILDASLEDLELPEAGGGEGLATPAGSCVHLDEAPEVPVPAGAFCADCAREGTTTVHLRMCLECGNVGCCDSSPATHATRHFHSTGHPAMRSAEPGEDWRWCYEDQLLG